MVLCQAVCQKPRAVRGIGKWIRACAFKCFFLGEKEDFVLRHYGIAHKDRIAGNIIAAQIQKPGDIVEGGHDMEAAAVFLHFVPDHPDLFRAGKACIFCAKFPDRRAGEGRSVRPDIADKIQVRSHRGTLRGQQAAEALALSGGHAAAVKRKNLVLSQMFTEIFLNGRNARLAHLHEADAAALQLLGSLDKIASVCPEQRFLIRYQRGSCRTCKTGQVCSAFEIITDIFGAVKIFRRHQKGVHAFFFHTGPECSQFLLNCHICLPPE